VLIIFHLEHLLKLQKMYPNSHLEQTFVNKIDARSKRVISSSRRVSSFDGLWCFAQEVKFHHHFASRFFLSPSNGASTTFCTCFTRALHWSGPNARNLAKKATAHTQKQLLCTRECAGDTPRVAHSEQQTCRLRARHLHVSHSRKAGGPFYFHCDKVVRARLAEKKKHGVRSPLSTLKGERLVYLKHACRREVSLVRNGFFGFGKAVFSGRQFYGR
jgi:hypothetical protein